MKTRKGFKLIDRARALGHSHRFTKSQALIFIAAFAVLGSIIILVTRASSPNASLEPESPTASITAPAVVGDDATASGGKYVQFGSAGGATAFQPTAPYYATFFYPWYKNPATDTTGYSYWQDQGNTPPNTWFSHYLPDIDAASFNPSAELYSSHNYDTFKWQVGKMAEAKQEIAISSWFGQGTKQDDALKKYLNDFMGRADNPYPNLRWSVYYECEGIATSGAPSCPSSTASPTSAQIVSDLNHFNANFFNKPGYLKIGGKPVVFVYDQCPGTDPTAITACGNEMASRWKTAVSQFEAASGVDVYYDLKLYDQYAASPNQPDSWHQYAPGGRGETHGSYSSFASPGFWLDMTGTAPLLARSLSAFQTAVSNMVAANTTWKLTETWNEWGEGSSVEPGTQTMIDTATSKEVEDPNAPLFANNFIQALADRLPALEQGTGR